MVVTQEQLQDAERYVYELIDEAYRDRGEPVRPTAILHGQVGATDRQERKISGTVLRRALQNLISTRRIEVTDGSRLRPVA